MNANAVQANRTQDESRYQTSLLTQIKDNLMANGNGTTKWVLIAVWTLTAALGGLVWEMTDDGIDKNAVAATAAQASADANRDRVDSLEYHIKEIKLEQRVANKEQNIQLAEIAKRVGARVTIDSASVVVDTVFVKDST
jgi:hypothetical protein